MKISVIPASTQVGRAAIDTLLKQDNPPTIRAIYRNTAKAPKEFLEHATFSAVQGGLDDNLNLGFEDSDAVLYVPPPTYDDSVDSVDHGTRAASKVQTALQTAGTVQRLVVLSALGAQHASGIGILSINHVTDKILANSAPEVLIVRPGWFQENWMEALETSKSDKPFFEAYFSPLDHPIVMVSFRDVGSTIATRLLETGEQLPSRPHVITMHGPRAYSMVDLQDALETVAGQKPRIDAIRPENLLDFYKTKLPPGKAEEIVEMNLAINGGGVLAGEMASPEGDVVRGPTTLVDTLRKLASGEVSKVASGAF